MVEGGGPLGLGVSRAGWACGVRVGVVGRGSGGGSREVLRRGMAAGGGMRGASVCVVRGMTPGGGALGGDVKPAKHSGGAFAGPGVRGSSLVFRR